MKEKGEKNDKATTTRITQAVKEKIGKSNSNVKSATEPTNAKSKDRVF
jgi:hypothetical protein